MIYPFCNKDTPDQVLAKLDPNTRRGQIYSVLNDEAVSTFQIAQKVPGLDAGNSGHVGRVSALIADLRKLGIVESSRVSAGSRKLRHRRLPHPIGKEVAIVVPPEPKRSPPGVNGSGPREAIVLSRKLEAFRQLLNAEIDDLVEQALLLEKSMPDQELQGKLRDLKDRLDDLRV